MAKLKSNNDFFQEKLLQTTQDTLTIEEDKNRQLEDYLKKINKTKEYISIDLLDNAPKSWNFFPPLSEDRLVQMEYSIMEHGILNPIICWKKGERYTILSGHNRVAACRQIIKKYDTLKERFQTVPAIIFQEHELTDEKALGIIIDTNYIQRADDKKTKVLITKSRVDIVKNQKDPYGKTIAECFKELELGKSAVYEDIALSTKIIPPLRELYFNGTLQKKACLKFAKYDTELQQWIYDSYKEKLTNELCMQLGKRIINKEQISDVFEEKTEHVQIARVSVRVKDSQREFVKEISKELATNPEFEEYCRTFLENKKKNPK